MGLTVRTPRSALREASEKLLAPSLSVRPSGWDGSGRSRLARPSRSHRCDQAGTAPASGLRGWARTSPTATHSSERFWSGDLSLADGHGQFRYGHSQLCGSYRGDLVDEFWSNRRGRTVPAGHVQLDRRQRTVLAGTPAAVRKSSRVSGGASVGLTDSVEQFRSGAFSSAVGNARF